MRVNPETHYYEGRKRTREQHEADLALETELYLKGYSYLDITGAINRRYEENGIDIHIGMGAVSADFRNVILRRWLNSSMLSFTEAKAKELAKLDRLELAYWSGWERSMRDYESTEVSDGQDAMVMQGGRVVPIDRKKTKTVKEQRDGAIQFLNGVKEVIEMRCKIFGLFSAQKLLVDWKTEAVQGGFAASESEANKQFEELVSKIVNFKPSGGDVPPEQEQERDG